MVIFRLLILINLLMSCTSSVDVDIADISRKKTVNNPSVMTSINVQDLTLKEISGDTAKQITLSLNTPSTEDIVIQLSASDISTSSSLDYILSSSELVIPAGALSGSVDIIIVGDLVGEPIEELEINLSSNNNTEFSESSIKIKIIDDDSMSTIVSPLFPVNGAKLGSVIHNPELKTAISIPDTVCPEDNSQKCIRGGEHLKVIVVNRDSCDGLTALDALGVFSWTCSDSTNPVFFYSTRMNNGKGIANLIELNGTNYLSNSVTVRDESTAIVVSSPAGIWWPNNLFIVTLNGGGADPVLTLSRDNTIYVQIASGDSRGILLEGSANGYVMVPGVTLSSYGAGFQDCDIGSSTIKKCLLLINGKVGTYIEGSFIGGVSLNYSAISIQNAPFGIHTTLRNISLDGNGGNNGIRSDSGTYHTNYQNIKASNIALGLYLQGQWSSVDGFTQRDGNEGLVVEGGSNDGVYKNIDIFGASDYGIFCNGSRSTFYNIKVSNIEKVGVKFFSSDGNVLMNALITNSTEENLILNTFWAYDESVIVSNTTSTLSDVAALNSESGSNTKPFVAINSIFAGSLLGVEISDTIVLENIISANNAKGIEINGTADDVKFTDKLIFGSNVVQCSITSSGVNPGLAEDDNGICDNQGASDAVITYGEDLANYFVGKVTDTNNPHGGMTSAAGITNWYTFENLNRMWTVDSEISTLHLDQLGSCDFGGNCMIFDWSLSATATSALNANGIFNDGDPCPAKADGDETHDSNYQGKFLKYAVEILYDNVGNDDGLCHSNERCTFSSNIGFAQQSGALKSCVFKDGIGASAVTGVTMFGRD